jgi:hypothetical protein
MSPPSHSVIVMLAAESHRPRQYFLSIG